MNLNKHIEYFDPNKVEETIHIVGVGAVGSTVAELLTRLGLSNFKIYDMDTVDSINIANQMFKNSDIGKSKVDAVEQAMKDINPDVEVIKYDNGWSGEVMNGYIFICVDSIAVRKAIVEKAMYNTNCKALFDFRMRLTDAQHYAAGAQLEEHLALLKTLDFSDDEAKEATPVSACGTTLSVVPTVREVANVGVINFMNYVKDNKLKKCILVNPFDFDTLAM